MLKELKVKVNVSKGSVLTGNAWIDVLFGGEKVVEHAEVTALFKPIDEVKTNVIEFTIEQFDDSFQNTLTILNSPETIGPIQIYAVEFYLNDENAGVTWQTATKEKPLRFGGQPSVTITNPHVGDPNFGGWSSVTDVSPGMSITWGLADLVAVS
jgi:hypothetical protein